MDISARMISMRSKLVWEILGACERLNCSMSLLAWIVGVEEVARDGGVSGFAAQGRSGSGRSAGLQALGVWVLQVGKSCSRIEAQATWRLSGGAGEWGGPAGSSAENLLTCTAAKWPATETGKGRRDLPGWRDNADAKLADPDRTVPSRWD